MDNIKDILASGTITADDLLAQLTAQIETAQKELEEERKAASTKEEELDIARESVLEAILNYLDALGAINLNDLEDGEYDKLILTFTEAVKETEGEIKAYSRMLDSFKGSPMVAKQDNSHCHCKNKRTPVMSDEQILKNFLAQFA